MEKKKMSDFPPYPKGPIYRMKGGGDEKKWREIFKKIGGRRLLEAFSNYSEFFRNFSEFFELKIAIFEIYKKMVGPIFQKKKNNIQRGAHAPHNWHACWHPRWRAGPGDRPVWPPKRVRAQIFCSDDPILTFLGSSESFFDISDPISTLSKLNGAPIINRTERIENTNPTTPNSTQSEPRGGPEQEEKKRRREEEKEETRPRPPSESAGPPPDTAKSCKFWPISRQLILVTLEELKLRIHIQIEEHNEELDEDFHNYHITDNRSSENSSKDLSGDDVTQEINNHNHDIPSHQQVQDHAI
ncbi:hypothetical protein M5K25_022126 [Dendrobium thyrsiflorum]|uniref:Uncharacterized protein n=1 Tax=Dendrobium thyrsiflorum TaxID=117978 RepID=A0ABD0U5Q1_DENTH